MTKIAQQFAEIEQCFSIFFFDGTLLDFYDYKTFFANYKPSTDFFDIKR